MDLDKDQKRVLKRMLAPSTGNVFVCWWDMGLGKTRVGLAAFEQSGFTDVVAVVRRVSFDSWIQEIEKCGLDYTIYCDSYNPSDMRRLGHANKRILFLSGGDLHNRPIHLPIGSMLIVDELYLFSNYAAKRSKELRKLAINFSVRIGLSGTIMPSRDNITIYGQMHALRNDTALASSPTEFRYRFQQPFNNGFGKGYKNKPGSTEEIIKLLSPFVDVNMPERRPTKTTIVKVKKTSVQIKLIKELKESYELDGQKYKFALQILQAHQFISNGWYLQGGNGTYKEVPSDKVDKCVAMIEELVSAKKKVVVWCGFKGDIRRIAAKLGKINYLKFVGGEPFDLKLWNKGNFPVVLATVANGASVNHFADVQYAIYFSIGFNSNDLKQSKMRHERKDSKHGGAQYYFLQTEKTIDEHVYKLVTTSQKTEQELVQELLTYINQNYVE